MAEKREIFSYQDGEGQEVWADPLTVHRRLYQELPDLQQLLDDVAEPEEGQPERPVEIWAPSMEKLIGGLRTVFALPAVDAKTHSGATEKCCLAALDAFLGYWEAQKKSSDSSPPSSGSTGPPPGPFG